MVEANASNFDSLQRFFMEKVKIPHIREIKKVQVVVISLFLLYTLALPRLAYYVTPCLSEFTSLTSNYSDCTLTLVLDRFLLLLFGGAISLNILVLILKRPKAKEIIALNILVGVIMIAGYYMYIPYAWKSINSSEVYLDSLR